MRAETKADWSGLLRGMMIAIRERTYYLVAERANARGKMIGTLNTFR
jgi:hypothetical protein